MRIKTYTSDSVSKALGRIRAELGPGAVIVNTKKKSRRRFFGLIPSLQYEITAAAEPLVESETVAAPPPAAASQAKTDSQVDCYEVADEDPADEIEIKGQPRGAQLEPVQSELKRLGNDIAELRNLVKMRMQSDPIRSLLLRGTGRELGELIWGDRPGCGDLGRASVICEQFERLVSQGIEDGLAFFLNQGAAQRLPAGEDAADRLKIRLNKEISGLIRTAPLGDTGARVCAFVGPTGVGKTTTIAKLAAQLALKEGQKVQLLTLDTYRIAAAEQLKTYGEIIGVPVRILFSVRDLDETISKADPGDYLLIDTTGHSHRKTTEFAELAEYLRNNPRIETHLVLSANTNPEDLRLAIDGFNVFEPDKLLFTKLDESSSFGTIVNELVRTVKPLSYLTNGQNVPDDLIVPSPATVADLVVPIN